MGEARRRKLAGNPAPPPPDSLSRAELLALLSEAMACGDDPTVTGMTLFPADGSAPVYLGAEGAKQKPDKRN